MKWRDRILSDPHVLRGKTCLKGTRIPAVLVLGYLAAGRETDAILKDFPDLTAADVVACLDYARALGHSIVTQADTWEELRAKVKHAVRCHFDEGQAAPVIRLHRVLDEVLALS